MDSCVFYKSFYEAAKAFPEEYRLEFYDYLFECCFEDLPLSSVPFPYRPVLIQMLASVSSAKDRHEKAKEDGAKGGKTSKKEFIPPEEWQAYRKTHTQKETAEHYGIALRTLQYWEQDANAKSRKNLNVNVNDNDNDNANDNVNVIINNNKNTGSNGETSKVPVLPELGPGECWTSEPMKVRNTGQWAAYYKTADGEERCMVFGGESV